MLPSEPGTKHDELLHLRTVHPVPFTPIAAERVRNVVHRDGMRRVDAPSDLAADCKRASKPRHASGARSLAPGPFKGRAHVERLRNATQMLVHAREHERQCDEVRV